MRAIGLPRPVAPGPWVPDNPAYKPGATLPGYPPGDEPRPVEPEPEDSGTPPVGMVLVRHLASSPWPGGYSASNIPPWPQGRARFVSTATAAYLTATFPGAFAIEGAAP